MPVTTGFNLAHDDLASLRTAFHMVGKHRFDSLWTADMATVVRLGQRKGNPDQRKRGRWAVSALLQCVHNGWLPLIYFVGGRRIRYSENLDGPSLCSLYPEPVDGEEGQAELSDGGIYPCLVNLAGFAGLLRRKFGSPDARTRGRPPLYPEFQQALDRYFIENPTTTRNTEVIHDIAKVVGVTRLPKNTVLNERISSARHAARMMPGK